MLGRGHRLARRRRIDHRRRAVSQVWGVAARPVRKPPPAPEARNRVRRQVRWAIVTAARRVPWRALCIQQGLAAQFMLRRRGIPSVLYYGAALREGDLKAHVWVRDGTIDVIGGEAASRYALLARFPA